MKLRGKMEYNIIYYSKMWEVCPLDIKIKGITKENIEEIRKDMDIILDAKDTVLGGDSVSPVGVYETTVAYLIDKSRNVVKN